MSKHEIELTHAAKAWCAAHAWPAALEARVRGEIASEMKHGLSSISKLMFHTFQWSKDDKQEFICTPTGNNVLRVDTCSREEAGEVEGGQFKGKKIMMPSGDSE